MPEHHMTTTQLKTWLLGKTINDVLFGPDGLDLNFEDGSSLELYGEGAVAISWVAKSRSKSGVFTGAGKTE